MNNWYERIRIDKDSSLVEKWLRYYNLNNYRDVVMDGYLGLLITHKRESYYIAIEPYNQRLRILGINNNKKKKKVYINKSVGEHGYVYGDNCWTKLFKELSRR